MARLSRLFVRALAVALVAAAALEVQAQVASEAAVKAAFIHKFLGYIEWSPASFPNPDSPIVVGTAGSDDVASELERLVASRPVLGRRVVVRKLAEGDRFVGLHVLFVARGEPATRAMVRQAREQGVLTITETERGLEQGAAINFVASEDRIGFEVSLDSAERSGHRISSRMLAVARRVVPRS
jgi:hypothetical protein